MFLLYRNSAAISDPMLPENPGIERMRYVRIPAIAKLRKHEEIALDGVTSTRPAAIPRRRMRRTSKGPMIGF